MDLRRQTSRIPWMTLSICVITLLIALIPGAATLMQWDRTAIGGGEWWRVFTGHLTHWNFDHLVWDLVTFAALGVLCEREGRGRMVACLAVASVVIAGVIGFAVPAIDLYRGLSGLDTALFVLFTGSSWMAAWRAAQWRKAALWSIPLLAMTAKLAYETATGRVLFVDAAEAGFEPLAAAHLAGAFTASTLVVAPAPRVALDVITRQLQTFI